MGTRLEKQLCLHFNANVSAGGWEMDADWYYMTQGWLRRNKRVGPISEIALLRLIDSGEIQPHTMLQSSKTKGKWVPMETIGAAMKRWKSNRPDEPSE